MNKEDLKEVETLQIRPFTRFCMSIGAVPSSYIAGLTIEEQLLWLCSYLEKEVIPAVNNNGEAVSELQDLFVELKNYVDNYFENLDVQEEINTKLDEMAEDGTLSIVLQNYLYFNNVDEMIHKTTLSNGMVVNTLGYHAINDGGKAEYIISNEENLEANGGSIIELENGLFAKLLYDSVIIPEQFGAYGDGTHDDYQAIQNAIDTLEGGTILFNTKTYLVGDTIVLHRGIKLQGIATFDDTNNQGSILKLKDDTNKSILKTPYASSGENATHYMILENLCFDGNSENQTQEVNLVDFSGAFIGSLIRNVFIQNFFGTGLHLEHNDLEIDHLWINNGYSLTNKYALDTNLDLTGTTRSCMLNINHLYIENIRNSATGEPRTTESVRGNGFHINKVVSININEFHCEACLNPIVIEDSFYVNINRVSAIWCGLTSDSYSSIIKLLNGSRLLSITNMFTTGTCNITYWISKNNAWTSNEFPDITYNANYPALPRYIMTSSPTFPDIYLHNTTFTNNANIEKIGTTDNINLNFKNTNGITSIKQRNLDLEIGTTINQSEYKAFGQLVARGGNGDRLDANVPLRIASLTSTSNIPDRCIYLYSNQTLGQIPTYQIAGGKYAAIATVRISSAAPTENAAYVGQMAIDTVNRKLYVATKIGSSTPADDWVALN